MFDLKNPFFLAPLAGITDKTFRGLCTEMGAALVYSEMVSAKGLHYRDKNTARLLEIGPAETAVGFQLFGSEPEIMAEAAEILDERENILIDVNMGCPVPKVVNNGEGSALMKTPALAGKVISSMKKKTRKPITAKIRSGWDKDHVNAVVVAKVLEDSGLDAIAVHGRTREQFYHGPADWDIIGAVKAAVKIPVIGNGDVWTGADAIRMMEYTGCDAVMIARGALGNPWIFKEACALSNGGDFQMPSLREIADMFIRQTNLVCEDKGEYVGVREMRKHVGWYFKGFPGVSKLKNSVNLLENAADVLNLIDEFGGLY
ncbi:MAG: tRNA dihydrouridine synthase DusB [Clostridiales Family XIII bacterium]|jgi:tRNA-dihydrouridine synthase B|nr:tRNA dihydrouridine synthase DusB [Clostridiales Family XIII bacterium]